MNSHSMMIESFNQKSWSIAQYILIPFSEAFRSDTHHYPKYPPARQLSQKYPPWSGQLRSKVAGLASGVNDPF